MYFINAIVLRGLVLEQLKTTIRVYVNELSRLAILVNQPLPFKIAAPNKIRAINPSITVSRNNENAMF